MSLLTHFTPFNRSSAKTTAKHSFLNSSSCTNIQFEFFMPIQSSRAIDAFDNTKILFKTLLITQSVQIKTTFLSKTTFML